MGDHADPTDPVPRPGPPRRPTDAAGAWLSGWLRWFGVARLLAAALSMLVVAGGAWWLVRSPAAPTEAGLPFASASSSPSSPESPESTLSPPATTSTVPDSVVVHVAGAVRRPGVYELPGTARVAMAIDAAGGSAPSAELDALNLAAPLADGQRVYVPERGEVDPASVAGLDDGATAGAGDAPAGPVDLNTATVAELEALPGIGPATATAIVDDRERNGPFVSIDELERVPGIGPAKLGALRDLVTV